MKRIIITVGAALLAAVPATMGLVGNTSFAQSVPVRVPSQATVVDDNGGLRAPGAIELGDDNGRQGTHVEPGDDKASTIATEPGDDNGGQRAITATEPGDDNGGQGTHVEPSDDTVSDSTTSATEPGDDTVSDSGSATDDNGGHGGDTSGTGGKDDGSGHS